MWNIYYETKGYAEVTARFTREEDYIAVASALEAQARAAGFQYVTESLYDGDLTILNLDVASAGIGRALDALGRAFPMTAKAHRVDGSTLIAHLGCAATVQAVERLRVSLSLPQLAYTVNGCAPSNAYDPDTFITE